MRYDKKSIPQLIAIATEWCNRYVRLRDQNKPCVSCGQFRTLQAGHFYSAGHYPALRFDLNNIHGQCHSCNLHLHGNLNEYRRRITGRISKDDLKLLDYTADLNKRQSFKWDRASLIDVIEECKRLVKQTN